ncbi:MAG TPA: CBS domain-containing protein, partial [Thermomicrobiaceae bacterium]|nr:CBS domain-containing protein [Thermomicrobiaceae bacterium]
VDGEGRLVGMLSRLDILRAVAGGLSVALPEAPACPLLSDETPASQALQGPVPALAASAELPDAAEPLLDSPFHLVFVVDPQGRLLGTLSAEELVARLEPSLAPSRLDRLRGRGLAHLAGRTLAEFMRTGVYAVGPDMPLARVLDEMLSRKIQVVPVIDAGGRPLGVITRDEMLRCAVLGTPAAG